jgi:hypothetical protein
MPGYHTNALQPFCVSPNVFGCGPGGRDEVEPASSRATFQVLVRLQYLRAQIDNSRLDGTRDTAAEQLENVIGGLRGLAVATLDFGSGAYAAMCLECAVRAERFCHTHAAPGELYTMLGAWLASSDHYLRYPARAAAAVDLVARFAVLSGEQEMFNTTAQSAWFRALLFPV